MRRRECGLQLYDAVGVAHGDRAASGAQAARNFVLLDAPHVAIVTSRRELGGYGAVDCGADVGTFLLAAQAPGVAAIPQAALAARIPEERRVGTECVSPCRSRWSRSHSKKQTTRITELVCHRC